MHAPLTIVVFLKFLHRFNTPVWHADFETQFSFATLGAPGIEGKNEAEDRLLS